MRAIDSTSSNNSNSNNNATKWQPLLIERNFIIFPYELLIRPMGKYTDKNWKKSQSGGDREGGGERRIERGREKELKKERGRVERDSNNREIEPGRRRHQPKKLSAVVF